MNEVLYSQIRILCILQAMKKIEKLLKIIILKLDRIYSHLEVDWDKLSEKELESRYDSMEHIVKDMKRGA